MEKTGLPISGDGARAAAMTPTMYARHVDLNSEEEHCGQSSGKSVAEASRLCNFALVDPLAFRLSTSSGFVILISAAIQRHRSLKLDSAGSGASFREI